MSSSLSYTKNGHGAVFESNWFTFFHHGRHQQTDNDTDCYEFTTDTLIEDEGNRSKLRNDRISISGCYRAIGITLVLAVSMELYYGILLYCAYISNAIKMSMGDHEWNAAVVYNIMLCCFVFTMTSRVFLIAMDTAPSVFSHSKVSRISKVAMLFPEVCMVSATILSCYNTLLIGVWVLLVGQVAMVASFSTVTIHGLLFYNTIASVTSIKPVEV